MEDVDVIKANNRETIRTIAEDFAAPLLATYGASMTLDKVMGTLDRGHEINQAKTGTEKPEESTKRKDKR